MTPAKNQVVINIDDFAFYEESDLLVIELIKKSRVTSVSICATSPRFFDALKLVQPYCTKIDLGVHLDLTFGRAVAPHKLTSFESGHLANLEYHHVKAEFRAQLEKCLAKNLPITHLDNHRPDIYLKPHLFKAVMDLAEEYNLFFRNPFDSFFIEKIQTLSEMYHLSHKDLMSCYQYVKHYSKDQGAKSLPNFLQLDKDFDSIEDFKSKIQQPMQGKVELLSHAGQQQSHFLREYDLLINLGVFLETKVELCRRNKRERPTTHP